MKKFCISSNDLKAALKKVGQAINPNTVLPITKDMLVKVGTNEVEFISTDLEITIIYKCVADTLKSEAYEFLLPYDFINDIVGVSNGANIEIELNAKNKARILIGEDPFELNSLNKVDDFPKMPVVPQKNSLKMDSNFVAHLSKALNTASKDDNRPALTRVLLDIHEKETFIVSTDSHAMYRYRIEMEAEKPEQIPFSKKMIKAIEGMDNIELTWTKEKVALKNEKLTVCCRLFDDRYPDYKVIIPDFVFNLEIDKATFIDAINKALTTRNDTGQVFLHLKKEAGFIHFESVNEEYHRKATPKIAGEYTGNIDTVSLNGRKVLVVLGQLDAEKIRLHIHTKTGAMLITSEEDSNHLGLLMPLYQNG